MSKQILQLIERLEASLGAEAAYPVTRWLAAAYREAKDYEQKIADLVSEKLTERNIT